ncbi:hypothetical protein R3P38DRAFT_3182913 [Favolaschia claudopus]|uniref:Uncharacterized protein n=1 Tax=Favolaschia claudopus TaxID=2862362 RepID=A0AAW0CE06_9AGAR
MTSLPTSSTPDLGGDTDDGYSESGHWSDDDGYLSDDYKSPAEPNPCSNFPNNFPCNSLDLCVMRGGGNANDDNDHIEPGTPPQPIDLSSEDEDIDIRALNAARYVPLDARLSVIPSENVTVSDLLIEVIPSPSTDSRPAYFSTQAENMQGTSSHWYHTLTTAVPFFPPLRASFNDALRDGAISICFPHLPGKRYPLWAENFLSEIQNFIHKRSRWQAARDWLDGLEVDELHTDPVNRCWSALGYLSWDTVIPGLSPSVRLTTQDLASFLGTRWVNDDMLNAGALANLHAARPGSYRPPKLSPVDKAISVVYFR